MRIPRASLPDTKAGLGGERRDGNVHSTGCWRSELVCSGLDEEVTGSSTPVCLLLEEPDVVLMRAAMPPAG